MVRKYDDLESFHLRLPSEMLAEVRNYAQQEERAATFVIRRFIRKGLDDARKRRGKR